ncbi:RagB/SusD family nutrient uptake outer membrane protein [Sphingobacterium bambusae]|uniref:RagB/SusD family nutrient uptake outer membrane protein n=1 Tax=Sphingobacterium bambusae TaxID=662858 RepID=A0ABW6BKH4_9SPHI|nr:RagB/SusD family nutrient uptake outer membrane protein [Sphingobacterium bambusae]WPL47950.1 RagB/SusD family nutrient uptake outer membrane protein [Sphingobacterium bambusae]
MKIKDSKLYAVLILVSLLFGSCRKYVEIDTYGSRTLKTTNDYQYLINNRVNFQTTSIMPIISNDDISGTPSQAAANQWGEQVLKAFLWSESFYGDDQQDIGWNNLYKHVYVANEILQGVMESADGSESQKQIIAAEARVHRAFAYFSLVNQYAQIYNPSTAANQLGVPLLLRPDLFQELNRAPLQTVYQQIVTDLEQSIDVLPNRPAINHHPSKLAVYALLTRVYMTMRDFEKAAENADRALALNPELINVADYVDATYPQVIDDPEVILSKLSSGSVTGPINAELVALYDVKDLRLTHFLENNASLNGFKYMKPTKSGSFYAVVGLSTPEIYLNRAEVYARQNNVAKTVELLNALRMKRFRTVDYVALTAADIQSDLLQAVIDERRREFVGTDLRWYDMRRLTLDGAYYKPVERTLNGQTYRLDANSPRFVYPINQEVLTLNPEIGQNPR